MILHELEDIDDETDKHGILLVTTDDMNVAISKANVTEFPALILFRNEEPLVYTGKLNYFSHLKLHFIAFKIPFHNICFFM